MRQTEKDTIDVVNYLRKMDADQEAENARLTYELKVIHTNYQAQKNALVSEHLVPTTLTSRALDVDGCFHR